MPDSSKKRRAAEDSMAQETAAPNKLSHRLFAPAAARKPARSRSAEESSSSRKNSNSKLMGVQQQQQQQQEAQPESPAIAILEGITRGSIANMVLARLGKLNPSELVGPTNSKPPGVLQCHNEDNDESSSGSEDDDEMEQAEQAHGADDDDDDKAPEDANPKEEITFFDAVQAQPSSKKASTKVGKNNYEVQSGPYAGARGKFWIKMSDSPVSNVPFGQSTLTCARWYYLFLAYKLSPTGKLHPIETSGYFILRTNDGRVGTVHHSQIKKVESGVARPQSIKRTKLTPQDKKIFVEDVRRYILYVTFIQACMCLISKQQAFVQFSFLILYSRCILNQQRGGSKQHQDGR